VGLLFPKFSIIVLSGCLAACMNPDTLNNPGFLAISGLFIFIIFNITKKLFLNIGGRPGTIGFFSNLLTFLIVYLISLSKSYNYYVMDYIIDYNYFKSLNIYIYIFGPVFAALSSLTVYFIAEFIKVIIAITHRTVAYAIGTSFGSMCLLSFKTVYRDVIYSSNPQVFQVTYGEMFIHFWHIGALSG